MSIDQIFREMWKEKNEEKKGVELKEVIYVASPYSHEDPLIVEENFKKVSEISSKIVANGDVAISPITYGHTLIQFTPMRPDWEFWTSFCLSLLLKCDKILVCDTMEGWERSKGVEAEISFARDHNIEIEFLSKSKYGKSV